MEIAANPIATLEAKVAPDIQKKLHESAKQYEGVFMSEMMAIMFKEIDFDPMSTSASSVEDNYKSMFTTQLGTAISQQSGIGLADPIYKSLLEAQIASQEKSK